jgi:glucose-1-phosphate cytidylyltransferase
MTRRYLATVWLPTLDQARHGRPRPVRTLILAGGVGSRLSEETITKPKPMVEIGTDPILWHILKHYTHFGHRDFVIALGYRGDIIKQYFAQYAALAGDITVQTGDGRVDRLDRPIEDWTVHLVDTGHDTATGGRLRRVAHLLDDTFMMTFGDGVSDVDIDRLIAFHHAHGRLATITAVRPPARFGHVELDGDAVVEFSEKPQTGEGWINGGYMVLDRRAIDFVKDDGEYFQHEPMERLAADGQLMAYRHESFWQCMDTMRDRVLLEDLWSSGDAPWKLWT